MSNRDSAQAGRLSPWPDKSNGDLPVSEMFYSIQGEGRFAGYPALFIRLKYCNLGCSWCDTRFTWDPARLEEGSTLSPEQIVEQVLKLLPDTGINIESIHVVITGGEPMLHQDALPPLLLLLKARGFSFFETETNGTIVPNETMAKLISWWNCSPKLKNNGLSSTINVVREAVWSIAATGRADFKFVVTQESDIDEIVAEYLPIIPREAVILMPEGITADSQLQKMSWLLETCAHRGFRFSTRLHTLAWNNQRGR